MPDLGSKFPFALPSVTLFKGTLMERDSSIIEMNSSLFPKFV